METKQYISSRISNSNFVSFSSPIPCQPSNSSVVSQSQPTKPSQIDSKSLLYESTETKLSRLRIFAFHLKQSIESAQTRTGNNENEHAIEHIYQVGNQQRLFVDYRPDESMNQLHTTAFLTQTFRGKLFIDEVYVCSGQGTNKKLCKKNCFQQALAQLFNDNFHVKLISNKNARDQYELVTKNPNENFEQLNLNDNHDTSDTKMNFVHARDTSTMAQRVAREQNKLERQYWQQWGRGAPLSSRFKRNNQRSLSPPPPVPHQSKGLDPNAVIEAGPTTQTYINVTSIDIFSRL